MRYYNTSNTEKMIKEKEHQINRYEYAIKTFEAIVKDPQLNKWDNKVFNKRFIDFICDRYRESGTYACKNSYGALIISICKNGKYNEKLEIRLYCDQKTCYNPKIYFFKEDSKRIDINKFKDILKCEILYYKESLEKLRKFDPEKAIKQRAEILKQIEDFNKSIPSYGKIADLEIY